MPKTSPILLKALVVAAALGRGDAVAAKSGTAPAARTEVAGSGSAVASASMRQHYDEAYRLQSAGRIEEADRQHKLFLAEALHRIANGRANVGDYERAAPLYEEAHRLGPEDVGLQLDYAKAAMDAQDPARAKALVEDLLAAPEKTTNDQSALAHRTRGEALRATGDHEQALAEFKKAAALVPDFENRYALGKEYFSRGDKQSGAQVFAGMVNAFGDTAAMHMDFGMAYAQATYIPDAIEEFKTAIAKDNRMPGLHYSLGAAYLSLAGSDTAYPQATAEFRKEVSLRPNDSLSYPQLGRLALIRHDYKEAETDLKRSAASSPQDADTFLLLGQLYDETDRPSDAEAALKKTIELTPDPSRNHYAIHTAYYQLGRLLMREGKKDEAKSVMRTAEDLLTASRQQDENIVAGKAPVQRRLGRTRVATPSEIASESAFEQTVRPLVAGSYNNLGVHAAMAKDFVQASSSFQHASEWAPDLPGLDRNWGFAAYAARQYAQAAGPLGRVLKAHPDDNGARSALGVSQYMARDYKDALETFGPIKASVGNVPFLALACFESMAKAGDFDQGIATLHTLERASPQSPTLHRALGESYAAHGDSQLALEELRTALQLDPADANATYSLAAALSAQGQAAEPEALLAQLAAGGSQDSRVYHLLGRLLLDRGEMKEAVKNLEAAEKLAPEDPTVHLALAEAYRKNGQDFDASREAAFGQTKDPPAKGPYQARGGNAPDKLQ